MDRSYCIFCNATQSDDEQFIEIASNAVEFDNDIVDFVDIIKILFRKKVNFLFYYLLRQ